MKNIIIAAIAMSVVPGFLPGQGSSPQPSAEHKKMEIFTGSWKITGQAKDQPSAPVYPYAWLMECQWLPGGFHVELRATVKHKGEERRSVELLGYDPVTKTFVSRGVSSVGGNWDATATLSDRTYIISGTTHTADGKSVKWRNTHVFNADWTATTVKRETEQDGKWWTTFEGKGQRTKPTGR